MLINHSMNKSSIVRTSTALLLLSAMLVGCQDKPRPATEAKTAPAVAPAPAAAKKPPLPAAEGAEMLTPTEMRAVQKIYQAQARQTITAQNAEAIVDALTKEIAADIASQKDTAPAPSQ